MLSKFILILAILILLSPFINASPYGYGDSMDLKYRIADGKIYYKYGNSTAYTTSLRPKDADRNWKADIRREVVDSKVAREIFKEEKVEKNKKVIWEDSNELLISNKGVKYEKRVLDEFDKTKWTNIIVDVKETSKINDLISNFNEEEFKDIIYREISPTIIGVTTTKSGFDKLINDEKVEMIHLSSYGSLSLDDSSPLINATYVINTLGYSGNGIKVCVIDSGVDKFHPALVGKISDEKCFCSAQEGSSGDCCYDGTDEDNNATDNVGHGTHVIGIIASQNQTYRGISPNVSVYVVKVTNSFEVIETILNPISFCET